MIVSIGSRKSIGDLQVIEKTRQTQLPKLNVALRGREAVPKGYERGRLEYAALTIPNTLVDIGRSARTQKPRNAKADR